jgi:nucleotide-binding universal stress UspA family protein
MAKGSLFNRILVPIDGSRASFEAVELALNLAKSHRGSLVICHALDFTKDVELSKTQKADGEVEAKLHELRNKAHEMLASATKRAQERGVHSVSHATEGEAVQVILGTLKSEKPSVVVMGIGGRGGTRNKLGSVAAAILAGSDVPVLLVREPK